MDAVGRAVWLEAMFFMLRETWLSGLPLSWAPRRDDEKMLFYVWLMDSTN